MERDEQRLGFIERELQARKWDAVVCTLPMNVLMVSGYWPYLGAAIAIATREDKILLLTPTDDFEPASQSWADEVKSFEIGSLTELRGIEEAVRGPLSHLMRRAGLHAGSVIGYEDAPEVEPSTYAAMNIYGAAMPRVLAEAVHGITLERAGDMLSQLRSRLTAREVGCLRQACEIVRQSYEAGRSALCRGVSEMQVAEAFRLGLSAIQRDGGAPERADGFVYCMSGPNSAKAYAAYQHSTGRTLECSDFVLVHCNSYVNGFWTDFTRTFCVGKADDRKNRMYQAVHEASRAALAAIRPGICAAEVDKAARQVLTKRGFGEEFRHATGHGVGFSAINHLARPRIHPKSNDVLESGATFNIEPAIYVAGYGGVRHCDVVTVTEDGVEMLTPFLDAA